MLSPFDIISSKGILFIFKTLFPFISMAFLPAERIHVISHFDKSSNLSFISNTISYDCEISNPLSVSPKIALSTTLNELSLIVGVIVVVPVEVVPC